MKSFLIASLAALSIPTASYAEKIDPSIVKTCMQAVDFKGCIETMTGETKNNPKRQKLLDEIRKLPTRIKNTSLRDYSSRTLSFIDALALSSPEEVGEELYRNAKKLELALDILYSTWDRSIAYGGKNENWNGEVNFKTSQALNTLFEGKALQVRCWTFFMKNKNPVGKLGPSILNDVVAVINYAANYLADSESEIVFPTKDYLVKNSHPWGEKLCKGDPEIAELENKSKPEETTVQKKKPKPVKINCNSAVWKDKPRCN